MSAVTAEVGVSVQRAVRVMMILAMVAMTVVMTAIGGTARARVLAKGDRVEWAGAGNVL